MRGVQGDDLCSFSCGSGVDYFYLLFVFSIFHCVLLGGGEYGEPSGTSITGGPHFLLSSCLDRKRHIDVFIMSFRYLLIWIGYLHFGIVIAQNLLSCIISLTSSCTSFSIQKVFKRPS